MLLNNSTYNFLKKLVQIGLPGLSALYFALAQIWDLPKSAEVIGTIAAITTFLGLALGLSTKSFNNALNPDGKYDGLMHVTSNEDGTKVFSLTINTDPENLEGKKEITFKVNPT